MTLLKLKKIIYSHFDTYVTVNTQNRINLTTLASLPLTQEVWLKYMLSEFLFENTA